MGICDEDGEVIISEDILIFRGAPKEQIPHIDLIEGQFQCIVALTLVAVSSALPAPSAPGRCALLAGRDCGREGRLDGGRLLSLEGLLCGSWSPSPSLSGSACRRGGGGYSGYF